MHRIVSLLFHDLFVRTPGESGFEGAIADRYKLSVDQAARALEALAAVRHDSPVRAPELTEAGVGFALTVDDGGVSYYTVLADLLEARGWRGHCFVSTDMIGRRGFLDVRQIRALDERGHVIGSHSATHPTRFSACTIDRMRREWTVSRQALEDVLGRAVTVASLPGGYYSPAVADTASEAGLRVLFTSEPTVNVQWRQGCAVVGRFTVRRNTRPQHLAALAAFKRSAMAREWAEWNAKKVVKPFMGALYPRVGEWIAARRASI